MINSSPIASSLNDVLGSNMFLKDEEKASHLICDVNSIVAQINDELNDLESRINYNTEMIYKTRQSFKEYLNTIQNLTNHYYNEL